MEGSLIDFSSLEEYFSGKNRRKSASKASIDALPVTEIVGGVNCSEKCSVCLGEWVAGDSCKEMPCKHRFHVDCIDKWLKIDGSCPVCRYEIPVDVHDGGRAPPPPPPAPPARVNHSAGYFSNHHEVTEGIDSLF
ncbi:hypothetical protein ABFS82_05G008400 [Erythranthe guttata]